MAVEAAKSDLIHDYLDDTSTVPDPLQARGRAIYATGTVANTAADSTGSTYHLADIPFDAMLLPGTFFDVENWGFAQVAIGTLSDTTALVNQTKATENIVTPIAQGDANHGKRVWEVLGLSANPGGNAAIYAHAAANATAAGTMLFQIAYLYN